MKLTISALSAALLLGLSGCAQDADQEAGSNGSGQNALGPTSVATVNGEPLAESVFRLFSINSTQRNLEDLSNDERERLLEELIRFELLAQEAQERGLLDERRVAAELELQRLQVIGRNMALRYLEENPPTEAELRAAYEENLPEYLSTQYKARHILLESEDDAREVIALLDDGGDFAELAQEHSTGPTGPQGGDLGYFSADSMVPSFAEAVRGMESGTYSEEPVQTQFGWHVILLEEVREQEPPGVAAVRNELTREVERQKLEAFVEGLSEKASIQRNE